MFPHLFDDLPDALLVVGGDGRIVRANRRAGELFGYRCHALQGRAVDALISPALRRAVTSPADHGVRAGRSAGRGDAYTARHRDGRQLLVEIAVSPLHDDHGRAHCLAVLRELAATGDPRDAQVRAGYDALVARIGRLALEAADDGSVIEAAPALLADALDAQAVALVLTRADHDGIELRAAFGLDPHWPESAQEALERTTTPFWQALAGAGPLVVEDSAERAAGSLLPFPMAAEARSGAMIPLLDRERPMGALIALSGQPRRFDHDALHLLQSVAHLLAALVQRRRTEDQLAHAQRLDAIGQLTGGIAHDFNNLLTVMSGNLQMLDDEVRAQPVATELVAGALRSVARGAELTGKLLAFARRQRLEPAPADACALLRELERMLGRTLGASIRIEIACDAGLPAVYADAVQLDAALVNLALNARDAMPRGGELVLAARECRIAAEDARPQLPAGRYVVFSVADTGHGMSKATRARAVEPFFTTKDTGRGSGLGLSMVYGFARQSGGHLRIDSELGYGTRIELYLPAAADVATAMPPATTTLAPARGETVLVVEDERAVRRIAVAFLQSLGYRVHACGSAPRALQLLRAQPAIVLLFSDVMLGRGMDGRQLAQAARRLRPGLGVLLTSGHGEPATAFADERDPPELLRKPYRREQLAAALRRSLARSHAVGAPSGNH